MLNYENAAGMVVQNISTIEAGTFSVLSRSPKDLFMLSVWAFWLLHLEFLVHVSLLVITGVPQTPTQAIAQHFSLARIGE